MGDITICHIGRDGHDPLLCDCRFCWTEDAIVVPCHSTFGECDMIALIDMSCFCHYEPFSMVNWLIRSLGAIFIDASLPNGKIFEKWSFHAYRPIILIINCLKSLVLSSHIGELDIDRVRHLSMAAIFVQSIIGISVRRFTHISAIICRRNIRIAVS